MNTKWTVLDTGTNCAVRNMELDAQLLSSLAEKDSVPVLHLYDWEAPSATYGHFVDPSMLLAPYASSSLALARRPTGGGLIFHTTDWAFSILVPASHRAYSTNTLDNYAFVNGLVIEVVQRFHGRPVTFSLLPDSPAGKDDRYSSFCMAKPTRYDVMAGGRKVAGGAQRRTRGGFLHQGTISLALPEEAFLREMLLGGNTVAEAMRKNAYSLLDGTPTDKEIRDARRMLASLFRELAENQLPSII